MHSDAYLRKIILQDFANNILNMDACHCDKMRLIFSENMRIIIDSFGTITPGEDYFTRVVDFQMPKFSMSTSTRNGILTQIELYMNKLVRNKGNIQTFGN